MSETQGWEPYVCSHNPITMAGKPIGMYHCPDCQQMVLAGLQHPSLKCEICGKEGNVYLTFDCSSLVCLDCLTKPVEEATE